MRAAAYCLRQSGIFVCVWFPARSAENHTRKIINTMLPQAQSPTRVAA
jgi:hypothetical protein